MWSIWVVLISAPYDVQSSNFKLWNSQIFHNQTIVGKLSDLRESSQGVQNHIMRQANSRKKYRAVAVRIIIHCIWNPCTCKPVHVRYQDVCRWGMSHLPAEYFSPLKFVWTGLNWHSSLLDTQRGRCFTKISQYCCTSGKSIFHPGCIVQTFRLSCSNINELSDIAVNDFGTKEILCWL